MSCTISQPGDDPTVQFMLQVTAPAATPDPRGGFFAPAPSAERVATPQKAAADGNADEPLPQRRKRMRARDCVLGTILGPAKRRGILAAGAERESDSGRVTLASALVKPSLVAESSKKGSTKTRRATKVSFLFEIFD